MIMDLQEKFELWIEKHPEIWEMFVHHTQRMIAQGQKHSSADKVLHEIRDDIKVQKDKSDKYKVNNNYTAYFSRKYVKLYPEHDFFFERRALVSKKKI